MKRPPKRLLRLQLLRFEQQERALPQGWAPFSFSEPCLSRPPALLQGGKSTHKQFDNGADPKNHFTIRIW